MSLQDFLANEFTDAEAQRLRQYQFDEISLKTGLLNGFREGYEAALRQADRLDILKRRAPYEYGEVRAGRPRRVVNG